MFLYRNAGNKLLYTLIEALWSRYPRDVLWTVPGRLRRRRSGGQRGGAARCCSGTPVPRIGPAISRREGAEMYQENSSAVPVYPGDMALYQDHCRS